MKVNFNNDRRQVNIEVLKVGATFLAQRKSTKELGLYMKIDSHSGINRDPYAIIAINLESGQLRQFAYNYPVIPTNAEVVITD